MKYTALQVVIYEIVLLYGGVGIGLLIAFFWFGGK